MTVRDEENGSWAPGRFAQGAVVSHNETLDVGHVVGFDRAYNDHGHETIIKVLWEDGEVRSIHPNNVTLI